MMNAGRGKRAAGHASSAEGSGRAAPAASPRAVDPRLFSLVVIVGYGLFRGVNANSYLSAFASVEAPFLFVPDLFFNVVVACSVVVCSVTVIALVLRGRLRAVRPWSSWCCARGTCGARCARVRRARGQAARS